MLHAIMSEEIIPIPLHLRGRASKAGRSYPVPSLGPAVELDAPKASPMKDTVPSPWYMLSEIYWSKFGLPGVFAIAPRIPMKH